MGYCPECGSPLRYELTYKCDGCRWKGKVGKRNKEYRKVNEMAKDEINENILAQMEDEVRCLEEAEAELEPIVADYEKTVRHISELLTEARINVKKVKVLADAITSVNEWKVLFEDRSRDRVIFEYANNDWDWRVLQFIGGEG